MLRFSDSQIVFEEVRDEISLSYSISGCPLRCKGCHSSFTWDAKYGELLTKEKLISDLNNNPHISCVLFYGGEWNTPYLMELIDTIKARSLKVCLYTGLEYNQVSKWLLDRLDYIKVGEYIEALGGLSSPNTNQRFIKLNKGENDE